jgi:hypothetical protein
VTRIVGFFCLIGALCVNTALAQTTSTPVAFVYVSNTPSGGANQVAGYAADANGKLTPVPGSPFRDDVTSMAVNGKYLVGSTRSGIYIAQFWIGPQGALHWTRSTDVAQYNGNDCGYSGPLFFDHTGSSLYDLEYLGGGCANNTYQSFALNNFTGQVHNVGTGYQDAWLSSPASFIGNNVYAYSASCLSNMYWEIIGLKRNAGGLLTRMNVQAPTPTAKVGDFWCPSNVAADPTNHVAIALQAVNPNFDPDGPARLATYTADADGNLSTTSTLQNMPFTSVGTVKDTKMAPSGKLLAVGGTAGLQVFQFNGSNPITHYTGLLTNDPIDQFFWDNANHLYAISHAAGKLFVFTITPTSVSQASGSPYAIGHPQNIIVQPKTPLL